MEQPHAIELLKDEDSKRQQAFCNRIEEPLHHTFARKSHDHDFNIYVDFVEVGWLYDLET
jgi:hypothetical protein